MKTWMGGFVKVLFWIYDFWCSSLWQREEAHHHQHHLLETFLTQEKGAIFLWRLGCCHSHAALLYVKSCLWNFCANCIQSHLYNETQHYVLSVLTYKARFPTFIYLGIFMRPIKSFFPRDTASLMKMNLKNSQLSSNALDTDRRGTRALFCWEK